MTHIFYLYSIFCISNSHLADLKRIQELSKFFQNDLKGILGSEPCQKAFKELEVYKKLKNHTILELASSAKACKNFVFGITNVCHNIPIEGNTSIDFVIKLSLEILGKDGKLSRTNYRRIMYGFAYLYLKLINTIKYIEDLKKIHNHERSLKDGACKELFYNCSFVYIGITDALKQLKEIVRRVINTLIKVPNKDSGVTIEDIITWIRVDKYIGYDMCGGPRL